MGNREFRQLPTAPKERALPLPQREVVAMGFHAACPDLVRLRIGSKLRCIRSTPTEMQSISENDFECLASTGVNTHGTMFPNHASAKTQTYT